MLPDRVSNPGPLTYEGALPIALCGPAFRLFKSHIRLNNLKTRLRFPCLGIHPIIDSIKIQNNVTISSIMRIYCTYFFPFPADFKNPSLSSLFISPTATVISVPRRLAKRGASILFISMHATRVLLHKHVACKI